MEEKKLDECEAIVLVFKREETKMDDSFGAWSYTLESVKRGKEIISENENEKKFIDNDGNTIPFINDPKSMNSKCVYAFPDYEVSDKEYCFVRREIENIKNSTLFQTYIPEENFFEIISIDPNNVGEYSIVYPYGIEGIYDIIIDSEQLEGDNIKVSKKSDKNSSSNKKSTPLYADEIYGNVSRTVICQDEAIKSISASIAKNSVIQDPRLKDNILICGPTGVGKTEIFRCISESFDIPFSSEDSTEYTASGYKGKDVTDMLVNLYSKANGDIEKTQRGIIMIDEIDKKISHKDDEVYSKVVLDSLLKMSEGHVYHIDTEGDEFDIDTSFITFAFSGAFSGIEEFSNTKRSLGFISEEEKKKNNDTKELYTDSTLIKYGLKPEFLGRNKLVVMNSLNVEDFERIIKESDKSQLLLYKYLFDTMGINFIYDEKTIEAIARKAKELGVGARSIKKIIENAFAIINYQVFSHNNYKELIISPETIEDNTQFILR